MARPEDLLAGGVSPEAVLRGDEEMPEGVRRAARLVLKWTYERLYQTRAEEQRIGTERWLCNEDSSNRSTNQS